MPVSPSTQIRYEARLLHELGYAVVPCVGKKPVVNGWQKGRLTLEELEAVLQVAKYNIAIVLSLSDVIDVECDTEEAESNLQLMFGGELPLTPTFRSKRGLHRLFRSPQGLPEKAVDKLDGVEFRIGNGKGAVSVVPPSVHPDGPRYGWLAGLSIHDVKPALLPAVITGRLKESPGPANRTDSAPESEVIKEGDRNNQLFKIGCKLVRSGLVLVEVEGALHAVNLTRCQPPLPDDEVHTIAKSALSQKKQSTPNHTEILLEIVLADSELWHTPEAAYATIRHDGHREHWPLRSRGFKQWLAKGFYDAEKTAVGSETMQNVLGTLEAKATFDGPTYARHLRTAEHEGRIYVDLADDGWRAVEVDTAGWRIVDDPPVRFCRPMRMLPLPVPQQGGSVDLLRPFVNVADNQWPLVLGWLVAALRPKGPYPVLRTKGEQGSAKSTQAKVARSFIDPNECLIRGAPGSERDLMIAAENGWVCAFDNLSHITENLSDALCRLSNGGGFGVRKHYEDTEETVFNSTRPIILNGIDDVGTRSDLMDRSLIIELPRIEEGKYIDEETFYRDLDRVRPLVFGALLTAVSTALRNLPGVKRSGTKWPRMTDFAQWAAAAEPALGLESGAFMRSYNDNRQDANQITLESSPVPPALMTFLVRSGGAFEGTATELLDEIGNGVDTRVKGWPGNAKVLSGLLARIAPNLRRWGLLVEHKVEKNNKLWRIEVTPSSPEYARTQDSHARVENIRAEQARILGEMESAAPAAAAAAGNSHHSQHSQDTKEYPRRRAFGGMGSHAAPSSDGQPPTP